MSKPLSDISVVELSTMIAGPYAGQMLGDLGADVVKIERPEGGELARNLEPRFGDESFYYLTANRNKRSLSLDITTERGREVFLDLVATADVVLENFPPSFVERYNIDYETLRKTNEDLIYCSISAYGATGPYRDYPGIDTTVQALSGAMSMARSEDSPPVRTGTPFNDVFTSIYAAHSIVTALYNREQTDKGDYIDLSLLDSGVAGLTTRAMYSLASSEPYPPIGRRHNYFAPEGVYEVTDGEVQLSVITDRHWYRFCEVIDAPELVAESAFETVNGRVANHEELDDRVMTALADWTVNDLVDALHEAGVPAAPINDTLSVWDDPQIQARNMKRELDHPRAGTVPTLGFPQKYENIELSIDRHPPLLGEHTEAVLS